MKKQMIMVVLASVIIMMMAGIGVASAEVIELDLGVYKYYETPVTLTIDVPADANKVEYCHYGGDDTSHIFAFGGWVAWLKINGDYVYKWTRYAPEGGYYYDYINGVERHQYWHVGEWTDVTSRANAGEENTITYYHWTGGPGFGTKVRITTETPEFPPVVDAGTDQTVEQTYYQGANVMLDGSGSSDPDGDPLTYSWTWTGGSATGMNPTVSLPLGTTTITLVVNDGTADSAPGTVVITVQDTTPPVITCPADVTVEQATAAGTVVPLTATATDICDADPTITSDELAIYPLGTTTVTFTATDDSGNSATCTTTVTVEDTTPPVITASCEQIVLWPPNHKYRTVEISDCVISVTDICDADVDIDDIVITSVSSDEPEDAQGKGDGNTEDDIVITASQTVELRAERQGGGNGRVYTINFGVTDASGNTETGSCTVWVPHDQSGDTAVDDGPGAGYTV